MGALVPLPRSPRRARLSPVRAPSRPAASPAAIGWPPAGAARSYLGERPGCTLVPSPRDASEPRDPGQVRPRRPPGGAEGERERDGEPRRRVRACVEERESEGVCVSD